MLGVAYSLSAIIAVYSLVAQCRPKCVTVSQFRRSNSNQLVCCLPSFLSQKMLPYSLVFIFHKVLHRYTTQFTQMHVHNSRDLYVYYRLYTAQQHQELGIRMIRSHKCHNRQTTPRLAVHRCGRLAGVGQKSAQQVSQTGQWTLMNV